jgi:hypothetical protein
MAAADAVVGEFARASKHSLPVGAPCPNCGTPLQGPWCHACGQKGEAYSRSIWRLTAEAFEGLTHFDGRFWRTLPRLLIKPGRLTRDYLDGHRASQIPPFRLFLVVLLLVFFAGGISAPSATLHGISDPMVQAKINPKDRADMQASLEAFRTAKVDTERGRWWRDRAVHALENPESFFLAMEAWGHRVAILMLPIAAILLSALFAFRRDTYVFDHLIFSMHSLSLQGLLLTLVFLMSTVAGWAWWLMLIAPVHLFVHMRGTYRTGVIGTLARMFLLFIGSTIAFSLLIAGLVLIGLATAH